MKKLILFFATALLIISCNRTTKEVILSYPDGKPNLVYYTEMKDSQKVLVAEENYYENGSLRYRKDYKEGNPFGLWKFYYDNEKIFAEAVKREYLDTEGQPVSLSAGYSAVGYAYDNSDNRIRLSYYNKAGELTWNQYGYCEIIYTYNERNHCIEEHLLNAQGRPAIHNGRQYSWLRREVDPDGKVLSVK